MGIFGGKKKTEQPAQAAPATPPARGKRIDKRPDINAQVKTAPKKQTKAEKARQKAIKFVQDTIPYESVFEDGIFVNKYGEYSKVYPIMDVNFRIESDDVQAQIYLDYQDLFNTFSSEVHLQISLVNKYLDKNKFHDIIFMKMRGDAQDDLRRELNGILESKEKVGDNEIVKSRYLTLSFIANNVEEARHKFLQLDKNVHKALERINHAQTSALSSVERLEMLYDFYNAGAESDFLMAYRNEVEQNDITKFDIRKLAEYGLTTKDVIAPDYFEFGTEKMAIGDRYAQALCITDFPTSLNTDFLVDLNNVHCSMITTMHCAIVDREEAAKKTAKMQTSINAEVIDAQKSAMKAGYDPSLIPQRIQYDRDSIQEIRDAIQKDNQKLIKVSIIIVHTADTLETLAQQEEAIKSIGRTKMVTIRTLKQQQERGLNSALPLGHNDILIYKTLPTRAAAVMVPFELQEMTHKGGFYYGLNTVSQRLILYNRKSGDNYNGLILGRSGSGKSFKAKEEILNSYLGTNDDVIILDPQGEYTPFVQALGGEAINFSAGCGTHINPFDMDLSYADEGESDGVHTNPLVLKNAYIGSICEIAVGGRFGLTQGQKSIIDRVLGIIYADFLRTGDQEDIPTMQDFYKALLKQPEAEAISIARPLEQFAVGSLDLFSHKTNVVLNNRLTCYNIKALTNPALKDMALVACLNDIWNRTLENRKKGKFTWIYMDEFHLFLKSEAVLDFLMSIWKRARKFGGGPTGITQNISDLLKCQAAETIFSNSSLIVMLNQAPGDRAALARLLNISENQQQYINNARKGSGLIWTGQAIIPFMDEFPTNTRLYQMMSTNAAESLAQAVASEKQGRMPKEETEKEKADREYEEYQKQQASFYQDMKPSTSFTEPEPVTQPKPVATAAPQVTAQMAPTSQPTSSPFGASFNAPASAPQPAQPVAQPKAPTPAPAPVAQPKPESNPATFDAFSSFGFPSQPAASAKPAQPVAPAPAAPVKPVTPAPAAPQAPAPQPAAPAQNNDPFASFGFGTTPAQPAQSAQKPANDAFDFNSIFASPAPQKPAEAPQKPQEPEKPQNPASDDAFASFFGF